MGEDLEVGTTGYFHECSESPWRSVDVVPLEQQGATAADELRGPGERYLSTFEKQCYTRVDGQRKQPLESADIPTNNGRTVMMARKESRGAAVAPILGQ